MIPLERFLHKVHFDHPTHDLVALARVGSQWFVGWNSSSDKRPRWKKRYQDGAVAYNRHAEEHVLSKIPRKVSGRRIEVFVLRIRRDTGGLGLAKPCIPCQNALRSRGVPPRNIHYTVDGGGWETLGHWDERRTT